MDVNNIPDRRKKEFLLVQAAQRGEQEAFAKLFDMYYKTIYYIVFRMVKNEEDAEDLTIESFTRAFDHIQYYVPTNAFVTWLSKIAVNRTIDFLRKKKITNSTYSIDEPHPQADDENATLSGTIEAEDIDPEEKVINDEVNQLLYHFIEQLPSDYSEIMKLRYFGQFSYKEIAEKLNLPLGTVKARLHRGKELLRSLIKNKKHIFR
jgi:RNA polymerase sigma-70 factor (ECF subfamily)